MGSFSLLTSLLCVCVMLAVSQRTYALDNGVAKLPVMGFNSLHFGCGITDSIMRQTAELMVSTGLKDLGYNYVNFDTCWSEDSRDGFGDLVPDSTRFPLGMLPLTSEIHALGMKAGIYGSSGWFLCNNAQPGSFQNELKDVQQWQLNWDFDFVKLVGCAKPFDDIVREGDVGKNQRMADAIAQVSQESGKPPLVLSLGDIGERPYLWGAGLAQSWRTSRNVGPSWASIASVINDLSFISWASDFYGHNDMDLLQVGINGLTINEMETQFTAWALLKSPLLFIADLSTISSQALAILKNEEIIAINQDPVVGKAVSPFRWGTNPDLTNDPAHPAQYWSGETQNGTVFMLINTANTAANMFFNLTESPWIRAGRQYSVRDLWMHTDNGTAVRNFTARAVPPHGVVALLLQDAGDEPTNAGPPCAISANCESESGASAQ